MRLPSVKRTSSKSSLPKLRISSKTVKMPKISSKPFKGLKAVKAKVGGSRKVRI